MLSIIEEEKGRKKSDDDAASVPSYEAAGGLLGYRVQYHHRRSIRASTQKELLVSCTTHAHS